MKLKNQSPVFRIALLGLNLALYIVLSFITIRLPFQEITFKGLPLVFISTVSGPVDGILIAVIGEFLNQAISPYGLTPTTALWILPHVLRAVIVGLMFKNKDPKEHKLLWIITVILSGLAVTLSNTLVIYIDALIFQYPDGLTAITILIRSVVGIVVSILYGILVPILIEVLKKSNKFKKSND